jgi:hypothetical protein
VPQVVEMEVGDSDLFASLPPADRGIEVSAMPRLPMVVDKHQPVRAIESVDVQVVLELGQDAAGNETMRIPARDFGGRS